MNTLINLPLNILSRPDLVFLKEAFSPHQVETLFKQYFPYLVKNTSLSSIKLIRYKPRKRCLIEYTFIGDKTIILLGKVRFKGTDTKSYYLQKHLWENSFDDHSIDNISVPEPIGIIPQWKMWLQRKVNGEITTHLLAKPEGINLIKKIAYAIHKLHQFPVKTERYHTINDELNMLHQKLPLVIELYPHWQQRIKAILADCERLKDKLSDTNLVGIHRDFYSDQVILDGERIYLLDLDLYCYGDPSLDIGNFLAHISEYSLRFLGNEQALNQQEMNLQAAFIKLAGADKRERIIIYKILTLVRHIYLSTQFPERVAYTEILMKLCEDYLQSLY